FGDIYLKQTMASGVIPQITALFGTCGGGAAVIPALSDFVFMAKEDAKLFVNSPNALDGNYEAKLDTASAKYQSEEAGLVDVVADTELDVLGQIRALVPMLPACNEDETCFSDCSDDINRVIPNLDSLNKDARAVLQNIADNNVFFEVKRDYAKDMVMGFIKLNGATIGCVANQVADGGDKLTVRGAGSAAEFVTFCDAFHIPLLTLTSVTGYQATLCSEKKMAKAVARLTYAFANATVPKVNLLIGEAYGSAYTAMNSKSLGADMEYAWPSAKLGMMDAEMAVKIIYAEELEKAEDKKALLQEKKQMYASLQADVKSAAARGYVDDIIEPDATRKRLIAVFEMLYTKTEERPYKKHGAI
nr:carboxyl transferase [Lachnospiraceae bacterium]